MKVIVSGSHGLIGTELVAQLTAAGHSVTRLVRGRAAEGEAAWDPSADTVEADKLEGHDAAVHLGGVGIGDHKWTDEHKRAVMDSRVVSTSLLSRTLAGLRSPPGVLAVGSAVGFYGDRGDEILTEESETGTGFLAGVVAAWEAVSAGAAEAGLRVVRLRTGVVLTAKGGALAKQLLPFKMGVGGRLGTGKQWLSWIALDDEVAAILRVLEDDRISGPVNLTSPEPVTNAEFTKTLGRVLRRPAVLPVPTAALNALFGKEMVDEMLLGGQRVLPARLQEVGFTFRYPHLKDALAATLGR